MDDELDPEPEAFFTPTPGEPSERDVWAAANLLIKQFGPEAAVFAAIKADEWLAVGDVAQYRLSKRVLVAIDELLATTPPPGTRPH